jgi:6-pyruvoyltetrahydropterin/6-carboxytetrahydropterin synthase
MSFVKMQAGSGTMVTLSRLYRFSASHRLHSNELGALENARLYGKCNNPFGHGHDYVLEVTIAGPVDPITGLLIPIARLDDLVQTEILQRFDHQNMNVDVPELAHLVPTTENLAYVITDLLYRNWHKLDISPDGPGPRLHRFHLQETDRNGFEVLLGTRQTKSLLEFQPESVTANV